MEIGNKRQQNTFKPAKFPGRVKIENLRSREAADQECPLTQGPESRLPAPPLMGLALRGMFIRTEGLGLLVERSAAGVFSVILRICQ